MRSVEASAPGKVLWIGSYTVVLGGLSHVIAIDQRVRCKVTTSRDGSWSFYTPFGNYQFPGNDMTRSVFEACPDLKENSPLEVTITNDQGFMINGKKTGLGSSSASTVAFISALHQWTYGYVDKEKILECALKANDLRQRGIGSGFDIASAVYGSVVYRRRINGETRPYVEPMSLGNKLKMALAFTGKSAETVGLVSRFLKEIERGDKGDALKDIEREIEWAIRYVRIGELINAIGHVIIYRRLLRALFKGIGLGEIFSLEEELEGPALDQGLALALLPGAGGGDSLLLLSQEEEPILRFATRNSFNILKVKEDMGVRIENE